MTIKQQGGIFGRNPTFNDANVDNDLTVSGSLGVGTTSPTRTAEIVSSNNVPMRVVSTASISQIRLVASGTTTGATEPSIGAQADGLVLRTNGSTAVTITAAQNIKVNSGNGIDFSATSGTGTSELFDDYEEGDWTPTIFGAGTAGSYTFTTQYGRYTKVGNVVYVTAQLTINTVSTSLSGNVRFGGWPYSSGTNTGLRLTVTSSGVNWDSSTYNHYYGYFAGATTMQLFGVRDNGAQANLSASSFTVGAGDTVTITGFYFV
jgi:hypothetical protein